MGFSTILLPIVGALAVLCVGVDSAGCPPANRVPGYKQTCYSDYDCKNGMICCANQSNTKSCTYPAPYLRSGEPKNDRWQKLGSMLIRADILIERTQDNDKDIQNEIETNDLVDCDGQKCLPNEVCKRDVSKKMICTPVGARGPEPFLFRRSPLK